MLLFCGFIFRGGAVMRERPGFWPNESRAAGDTDQKIKRPLFSDEKRDHLDFRPDRDL